MSEVVAVGNAIKNMMKAGICQNPACEAEFEYLMIAGFVPPLCEKCHQEKYPDETNAQIIERDRNRKLARQWERMCPKAYRTVEEDGETRMEQLMAEQGAKLAEVLMWNKNSVPRGIVLHGVTGTCKTRCAWRLIRRLYEEGVSITVFNCAEFSQAVGDAYRAGREAEWRRTLVEADIVFFDDLWKDAFTDRVDSELCWLIEKRHAECKPYFVTTNSIGKQLEDRANNPESRLSMDRLKPVLRRIRHDCRAIYFTKKNEKKNPRNAVDQNVPD